MINMLSVYVEEKAPVKDLKFLDFFPNTVKLLVWGSTQDDGPFNMENIMNFPRIHSIDMFGPSPVTLHGLEFCPELEKLIIKTVDEGDIDITAIQGLTNLKVLKLSRFHRVNTHSLDLSGCTSLTDLKIPCDNLTSDLNFIRRNRLSRLNVCGWLKTLDGLDVEHLVYLKIRANPEHSCPLNIEPLIKAHNLKKLILIGIEVENASVLDQLKDVEITYRF